MRKGQTAMEYLMTYGWAILIIIVVVAALYGMGVFSVQTSIACSPCVSYFAYRDYDQAAGLVYLVNGPRTVTLTGVAGGTPLSFSCGTGGSTCAPGVNFTVSSFPNTAGTDVSFWIEYTDQATGVAHNDTGTIHNPA
jgi:hypothetical protein